MTFASFTHKNEDIKCYCFPPPPEDLDIKGQIYLNQDPTFLRSLANPRALDARSLAS